MKKLAIIGCGGIGTYHLGQFIHKRHGQQSGISAHNPERAEKIAKTAAYGRAFTA